MDDNRTRAGVRPSIWRATIIWTLFYEASQKAHVRNITCLENKIFLKTLKIYVVATKNGFPEVRPNTKFSRRNCKNESRR